VRDPNYWRDLRELQHEFEDELKRSSEIGIAIVPLHGRGAGIAVNFTSAYLAAKTIIDSTHRRATAPEIAGWKARDEVEGRAVEASEARFGRAPHRVFILGGN
jgi:hypothetical protein